MFRQTLRIIFSKHILQKLIAFFLFIVAIYLLRDFLPLFLVTFIFAYLFIEVAKFLSSKIQHSADNNLSEAQATQVKKWTSPVILVTVLYIVFIMTVSIIITTIFPRIIHELERLIVNLPIMLAQVQQQLENFESSIGIYMGSKELFENALETYSLQDIGKTVLNSLRDTGGILLKFMIGVILSYIYIIDRNSVSGFLRKMRRGNFRFIYDEFSYIGGKLAHGFGGVFKAQSLIAVLNAILTVIGLVIIGHLFGHNGFPYIFTLALIVFICGFVPVFGTFLSSVPILIIGTGMGGINISIAIIIMVAIVHAIEAYILNPKIVSSYVHFPVFITLLTLLIGEHVFGFIGLLIAIPLLSVSISLLGDFDVYVSNVKRKLNESQKSKVET